MTATLVATSVQRSIGLVVAWIVIVGFAVYVFTNIRKAKPELGNEVETAPNRKPYYSDEELEGPRLDRLLTMALVLLGVLALGLPRTGSPSRDARRAPPSGSRPSSPAGARTSSTPTARPVTVRAAGAASPPTSCRTRRATS